MDLNAFNGRAVALASLFRHLTPGAADYARMTERANEKFGDNEERG